MFGAQRVPRVFVPDSSWVMVCRVLSVGDCVASTNTIWS